MTNLSERMKTSFNAAIAGVPGAIDRFLAAVHTFAVRYCRAALGRQGKTYMSADRTAQEICREVLVALPTYLDHRKPVLAVIYNIAAHKTTIHPMTTPGRHRKNRSSQQSPRDDPIGKVSRLLSHLPTPQREIIILRVAVGFSAEETAEAIGSTPSAVRLSQHRALTHLRGGLAKDTIS